MLTRDHDDDVQDPAAALTALAGIVGARHVIRSAPDRVGFDTDWRGIYRGQSLAVVQPADTDQVSQVVGVCARRRIAIVPQGGNTGLCGGATPDSSGRQIVLGLGRMRRLRGLDAEDAVMTCEAGMPLAEAQAEAERAGLLLPLSIASEGTATVGGTIATNAGGVNVLHYGSMRRMVLGVEAVLADGSVWSDLGGLRKDNTGYALSGLLAGSEGTLGIITAASLSLSPRPTGGLTFLAGLGDAAQANIALARLRAATGEAITAWELFSQTSADLLAQHGPRLSLPLSGRHRWYLLGEMSFFGATTDRAADALEQLAAVLDGLGVDDIVTAASTTQRDQLWALRDGITLAERAAGPSIKHDISVRPGAIARLVTELEVGCATLDPELRLNIFGHVGDGNLHVNVLPRAPGQPLADSLTSAATRLIYDLTDSAGGSFSAEHGIGQSKRAEMRRYKGPAALDVMVRMKRALDPQGILNPGKVLP